jgi:hypothetical protein
LAITTSSSFAFDFSFWYQRNGTEAVKAIKNLTVTGVDEDQKDDLLEVIKGAANWVFGILALLALIIVMYGWFLMLTSAGEDDAYSKGRSIMRSALIWLVIIGVAWFVVSGIIWLIQQAGNAAEWSTAGTES